MNLKQKYKIFAGMCLFTTEYVEEVIREVLDQKSECLQGWIFVKQHKWEKGEYDIKFVVPTACIIYVQWNRRGKKGSRDQKPC